MKNDNYMNVDADKLIHILREMGWSMQKASG